MTTDPGRADAPTGSVPPAERQSRFGEAYFAEAYGGSPGSYEARAAPNKWRSMCRFVSRHVPSPVTALDVGCAEGVFLRHAIGRMPRTRWSGTDVSEYALERARASNPGTDLRQGPATELAFGDASFDLVTAFDVLEHIEDLPRAVSEIARVLRPGGHLVVSLPVYDGPLGWVVHALDKDPTHVHKVGREWWREGPLSGRFTLEAWDGAFRYYLGRYWHYRATWTRTFSPAIVMAWRRK